jgi:mono/diheme cytochrome c family protein
MRASLAVVVVAASATAVLACGSSPAPAVPSLTTTPLAPARVDLTGTWSGTGADSYSPERIKWVLAQADTAVTGTAEFAPMNPADGSCASCHKLRKGTSPAPSTARR